MTIILIPIGPIDAGILGRLEHELAGACGCRILPGRQMPEQSAACDPGRGQYHAGIILQALSTRHETLGGWRVLAVTESDLYIPGLRFAFGAARGRIAVISLYRLRETLPGRPDGEECFFRRAVTEAVHELGHTLGLAHCNDPACAMFRSDTIADTDTKNPEYCPSCQRVLYEIRDIVW